MSFEAVSRTENKKDRGQRRLSREYSMLERVRSKAGKWMAAAMMALTLEGVGYKAYAKSPVDMEVTFEPKVFPMPNQSREVPGIMMNLTFREVPAEQRPLLTKNRAGRPVVDESVIHSQWLGHLKPGQVYVSENGKTGYQVLAFSAVRLPFEIKKVDLPKDPGLPELRRQIKKAYGLDADIEERKEIVHLNADQDKNLIDQLVDHLHGKHGKEMDVNLVFYLVSAPAEDMGMGS